jgi:GH24 family phage-related lysozyme (muramidase)
MLTISKASDQHHNIPWLLVNGDFVMDSHTNILLEKGWDWFQNAVRGRYFPQLNITTATIITAEKQPELGDSLLPLDTIRQKFPGATIVSLIGQPHAIGKKISANLLQQVNLVAKSTKWKVAIAEKKQSSKYLNKTYQFDIADVDRYITDKYAASVTLQETNRGYSVGFQVYNNQVGLVGCVHYWHYDGGEKSKAESTFSKVKTTISQVLEDIGYFRPPMALISPMMNHAVRGIDLPNQERSGVYHFNWAKEVAIEPDWRTTLYGNRYPVLETESLEDQWNVDESSKQVVSEGQSSRSRVLRYKPYEATNIKVAANYQDLLQLIKDAWKIGSNGAAGAVLAWLINLGLSTTQLEASIQQGMSPQEIANIAQKPLSTEEVPVSPEPVSPQPQPQPQPPQMQISDAAVQDIMGKEGYRQYPYEDPNGHCTIGYGHLLHRGSCTMQDKQKYPKGLSQTEALDLARSDLEENAGYVKHYLKTTLNQAQFDSLVSHVYNRGIGNVLKSGLFEAINKQDFNTAAKIIQNSPTNGLRGLQLRREQESLPFSQNPPSSRS